MHHPAKDLYITAGHRAIGIACCWVSLALEVRVIQSCTNYHRTVGAALAGCRIKLLLQ